PLQAACTAATPLVVAQLTESAAVKPTANVPGACGTPAPSPLCGPSPSNVDAAIAQINTGQVDLAGTILDLGPAGTSSIAPAPPSSTVIAPALGQNVGKSGRTTGLTCSTVNSISADVQIDYEGTCGDNTAAFTALYRGQVMVAGGSFSAGGDSGSLIVTTDNARPIGLLYGGNSVGTVANPLLDTLDSNG